MTDKISDALIDEMLAGLEGVTPGPYFQTGAPWFRDGTGVLAGSPDGNIGYLIADTDDGFAPRDENERFPLGDKEKDAAHFTRCDPETIRALLLELRAYRTASHPLQAVLDRFPVAAASGSTKEELLPCPFCGGGSVSVHGPRGSLGAWVACSSCGLETPTETGVTTEQAFAYWNRRASALETTPAPVTEITEEKVERLCFAAAKYAPALGGNYSRALFHTPEAAALRAALTAAIGGE